ncbi:hypothetical protein ACWGDS_45395 [Streptomyces sp. NPDC055059]
MHLDVTAFQQAEGGVVDLIGRSLPVDGTTCRPTAGDLPAVRDFVAATPGGRRKPGCAVLT